MAETVLLPKQGNSVESCIIVAWKVSEGDSITKGQPIMEVETDKATMDVEATAEGTLLRQLVQEGDDVPVLAPIAVVGEPGEDADAAAAEAGAGSSASTGSDSSGTSDDAGSSPASPVAPSRAPRSDDTGGPATTRRGGAKISPRARRLASERGVAYEGLSGTGPGGRIMVRDIESAIESGGQTVGATAAGSSGAAAGTRAADGAEFDPAQPVKSTSVSGVRKVIAERMHASLATTAQLTMSAAADARAVLAYRKKLKASNDENLASVSINDLVLFATSRVVAEHGFVNATFANGTINEFSQVDLGFAVDTPRGLMVPVIRAADRRSLTGIAAEAHRLAAACLDGSIKPDEFGGGTFTVTNLGVFGIESFTPVLNVPQVAILGVCAVTQRPTADGLVPHMGLSLTVDHQVVDGAPAARFLQAVGRAIGEIDLTLAR